jgi:hypothetical protein
LENGYSEIACFLMKRSRQGEAPPEPEKTLQPRLGRSLAYPAEAREFVARPELRRLVVITDSEWAWESGALRRGWALAPPEWEKVPLELAKARQPVSFQASAKGLDSLSLYLFWHDGGGK